MQETVDDSFRVQVLVLIAEKTLLKQITQSLSSEFFEKDEHFTMGLLYFESLSHMNVISYLNPILHSILDYLFFVLIRHLLVLLKGQNSVLLFQNRVGR